MTGQVEELAADIKKLAGSHSIKTVGRRFDGGCQAARSHPWFAEARCERNEERRGAAILRAIGVAVDALRASAVSVVDKRCAAASRALFDFSRTPAAGRRRVAANAEYLDRSDVTQEIDKTVEQSLCHDLATWIDSRDLSNVTFASTVKDSAGRLRTKPADGVAAAPLDDAALLWVTDDPKLEVATSIEVADGRQFEGLPKSLVDAWEAAPPPEGRDRWKVSVDEFVRPSLDDEILTLSAHRRRYSSAWPFHYALRHDPDGWELLAATANSGGRVDRPNILCTHGIVTLHHEGRPFIAVTHRRKRTDRIEEGGGYHWGSWSCSFEEQVDADRLVRSRNDLSKEATSGLAQELTGDRTVRFRPRLVAIALEQSILNFALIWWWHWPTSLRDLVKARESARDRGELEYMTAIPLDEETRQTMSNTGLLPTAKPWPRADDADYIERSEISLHPTALTRYSMALWISRRTDRLAL